jgi:hypothetical protein
VDEGVDGPDRPRAARRARGADARGARGRVLPPAQARLRPVRAAAAAVALDWSHLYRKKRERTRSSPSAGRTPRASTSITWWPRPSAARCASSDKLLMFLLTNYAPEKFKRAPRWRSPTPTARSPQRTASAPSVRRRCSRRPRARLASARPSKTCCERRDRGPTPREIAELLFHMTPEERAELDCAARGRPARVAPAARSAADGVGIEGRHHRLRRRGRRRQDGPGLRPGHAAAREEPDPAARGHAAHGHHRPPHRDAAGARRLQRRREDLAPAAPADRVRLGAQRGRRDEVPRPAARPARVRRGHQLPEQQVRFLLGWLRTTTPWPALPGAAHVQPADHQRGPLGHRVLRAVAGPEAPEPRSPGELRWFATIAGKDVEVPDNAALRAARRRAHLRLRRQARTSRRTSIRRCRAPSSPRASRTTLT